jgi:leader peptidase (prepilin peptidase)/N-methyltransferase
MTNPFAVYADLPAAFWTSPLMLGMVFVFGACWGSFLNVCVFRIPNEISLIRPGSRCPRCLRDIAWHDNLPVLGWILLRGRCRRCRQPISIRYPLVEALTGLCFVAVWWRFGPTPVSAVYGLVMFGLLLGTLVDLEHYIIPDRVSLGGIVLGLILSALVPALHPDAQGRIDALRHSATGAALGWGSLHLVSLLGRWLLKKDAMGFGDVKLLSAIGAFFGWQAVVFTIIASSFLGSIIGVIFVLWRGRGGGTRIPFGPYLALGAVLWMFQGPPIVRWYLGTLNPPGGGW